MKLLKELHDLTLSTNREGEHEFSMTIREFEYDGQFQVDLDLDVTYDYQAPSSTLHVRDDPTTREHHPSEAFVRTIKVADDIVVRDPEDDSIVTTIARGTSAESLPGWRDIYANAVYERALEETPEDDDYPDVDDY